MINFQYARAGHVSDAIRLIASDPTAKAHFHAMAETWERRARQAEKSQK